MRPGDTICAVASAPGRSGRGVIRVSGPAARAGTARLLTLRGAAGADAFQRGAHAARLRLERGAELPTLVLCFAAPASYTGEDVLELQLPGNPTLLDRVMDAALAVDGVRRAAPGEFTARAFLNGRLSIEQAEGVAMTIAAAGETQRVAAAALMAGATGGRYRALADAIAGALALVEAGVDFTDQEDVVPIAPGELSARLEAAQIELASLLGPGAPAEAVETSPVVALVGAPNAGKSTLFNALLGRRRAIVSDEPGTTRDAIAERLDLSRDFAGGAGSMGLCEVTLLDLAGLDAALARRSAVDESAQRAARRAVERADVLLLCDPSGKFDPPPWAPVSTPVIRVRTKADQPAPDADEADALAVCALDGWNLGALRRAIADAAQSARSAGALTVLPRHRAALAETARWTDEALARLHRSRGGRRIEDVELIAEAMRAALDAIGEIAGKIPPDDVIGRIFASFCVGK